MLSPWPADLHGEQLCNPATLQHPDFRTGSFGDNPARSWRFCFAAESRHSLALLVRIAAQVSEKTLS
jgi:hypothetical protein